MRNYCFSACFLRVGGGLCLAGRVFDTKRHTNVKRRAEYRRINRYYKSLEKTKAEKARRRRIVDLQCQGYTIKQIALQLHVSERTVKRDLSRMEPYFKVKRGQLVQQMQTDFLGSLGGLSYSEQLEAIRRYVVSCRRVLEPRSCKNLGVTINLDSVFLGECGVKFKPDLPVKLLENGRITVELEVGGRKQAVARMYVGKIGSGAVYLSTNQSMVASVVSALKGLKVTPSTTSESADMDSVSGENGG